MKERSGGLAEVLLLTGSLVFACLIGEAAFRLVLGDRVFERVNYRSVAIGGANQGASAYDSELGWVLRPDLKWTGFSTLPYGIRSNGNDATELRAGGVLAVGDSFTAGSEVHDHQTWPAQLEGLIGQPVMNGGVGGYGTDHYFRFEAAGAVPEPASWAMMLGGFGMIGGAMRSRRKAGVRFA